MRNLSGVQGAVIGAWAAAATALHIYYAAFGWPEPLTIRALHFTLFLPLVFLLFPARKDRFTDAPSLMDWGLAFLSLLPNLYIYLNAQSVYMRSEYLTPLTDLQYALGVLIVVLILEGVRRALTPILAVLTAMVIGYMFVAHYLPGMWYYRNMPVSQIVETMFLISGRGIYGPLMGISATLVTVFITFGAFVRISGTGRLFSNLGEAIAGKYSGGPAKVAVISSGLFGTMSGSAVSNVASTGVVTIPLMKRLGYRGSFAGGIETAASVGGAIMPPVMGAASFLMAEVTGVPYRDIIIAASLGAVLYYATILLMVHLEAKRLRLQGMPIDKIPSWRIIAKDAHLLIPLVTVFVMLMSGFSPRLSAISAIGVCIVTSWFKAETRMGPRQVYEALAEAGKLICIVAVAIAAAGIIVAGLTTTGLVIAISSIIHDASGGQLWLACVMVALVSLFLGMGVPVTPAYLIVSVIGVPILVDLGAPLLGAHLFVFYFAILADATPPVSVASFTAAVIAKSNAMRTGYEAWKLAIGGLIVAFSFVFVPAFMWQGTLLETLMITFVNLVAVTMISIASIGYFMSPVSALGRGAALVLGITVGFSVTLSLELRFLLSLLIIGAVLIAGLRARSQTMPQVSSR